MALDDVRFTLSHPTNGIDPYEHEEANILHHVSLTPLSYAARSAARSAALHQRTSFTVRYTLPVLAQLKVSRRTIAPQHHLARRRAGGQAPMHRRKERRRKVVYKWLHRERR